jgi:predicted glycosyltransferase
MINELVNRLRSAQDSCSPIRVIIITGPLVPHNSPEIEVSDAQGVRVSLHEYESLLPDLLAAAHVVICRGGYNTINDVLAIGVPSIAIPVMDIFDDQCQRISWAVSLQQNVQAGVLDAEDIERRIYKLMEQPWWCFVALSPDQDIWLQHKIAAAKAILNCASINVSPTN